MKVIANDLICEFKRYITFLGLWIKLNYSSKHSCLQGFLRMKTSRINTKYIVVTKWHGKFLQYYTLISFYSVSEHLISTTAKLSVPVFMILQLSCIDQNTRYLFIGSSRMKKLWKFMQNLILADNQARFLVWIQFYFNEI